MDDLPVFPDFPEFLLREPAHIIRVQRKLPTPRMSPVPRMSPCFGDGWYDSLPVIPGPVYDIPDDDVYDCFISPKRVFRDRLNSLPMEDSISESSNDMKYT